MNLIVRAAPPEHYEWLTQRAGVSTTGGFRAIEAVEQKSGRILGMVGYDDWTYNACECHCAAESPIAWRALIFQNGCPAFSYPFEELGIGVLLAPCLATNKRSLRLLGGLGFKEVYRIRDGHSVGNDLLLFEMRKENCQWLGKQSRRAA